MVSTCCGVRVYFHLLSEKCPPIILDKMLLFDMPFSKRALWIISLCQLVWKGILREEMCKCPFALSKMPFYIPWENALIQNSLLKRAFLIWAFLSRDIGGHFWKGKRAFPPNRQKPLPHSQTDCPLGWECGSVGHVG